MSLNPKCGCTVFYLFGGRPQCLHYLFATGQIKAITREVTRDGAEFYIFSDKVKKNRWGKWILTGNRSHLTSRDQVLLAIELAEKYKNNVKRIRL